MKKLTNEFTYLGRKYQAEIVTDGDEYSIDEMWFYIDMGINIQSRWLKVDITDEELSLFIAEDSDRLFGIIDKAIKEEGERNV